MSPAASTSLPPGPDGGRSRWTWVIRTGALLLDGHLVTTGYAGTDDGDGVTEPGEGRNDPAMQGVRGVGPIPVGRYAIGPPFSHPEAGPYTLLLAALAGTDTRGRSGFLIHGDSVVVPGTASHGCIVLPRWTRVNIWGSGVHEIDVIADPIPAGG